MPDAEIEWRVVPVEKEIYAVRRKALEKASLLGEKGKKALEDFNKAEFEGKASSYTQKRLKREIDNLHYELVTSLNAGTAEKGKVKELSEQLRTLSKYIKDETERSRVQYNIDSLTGKVKGHKPGSYKDTIKAGKAFLAKHDEGLRSALSLIRRTNALEEELRRLSAKEQEEKKPGWLKRKMRISSAIMKAAQKRGSAEARLQAKMKGIREELLQSKLSEKEIDTLVGRINVTGSPEEKLEARRQLKEFARMFNGKGLVQVKDREFSGRELAEVKIDPAQRAHASPTSGWLTTSGEKHLMFHEAAHVLEAQRPWLIDYAGRWRDAKAFSLEKAQKDPNTQRLVGDGETISVPHRDEKLTTGVIAPVYRLNQMLPLRQGKYKDDEVAVVDTYMTPYMGKRYGDNLTEVVSMTIEYFSEPHLMAHLYKNHPDLFLLGVGLAST